jgi:hypothetical protein
VSHSLSNESSGLHQIFITGNSNRTPVLITKYYSGNKIEKEMGAACNTYGEKRGAYRILVGDLSEGDHLADPGVGGRIILKWIFKKWDGDMDWIELAQYRDRWRALVDAVVNFWVPQNAGNSLTS